VPEPAALDLTLVLPGGETLSGTAPVVIIGPNGSGKTREARQITSPTGVPVAFVNALRNTRVTTEVPSIGLSSARSNLQSQGNQAKAQYWELVNDFDVLLARLHAEDAAAGIAYRDAARANESPDAALSSMEVIQSVWRTIFPGRSLSWNDNIPMVQSSVPGSQTSYQGHYMSDGEKAALYLAGKVMVAEPGILVIDEPETHFHSLLAVDFWDALEQVRSDLRLVYITHDLSFGMSRRNATFVLSTPGLPMRVLDRVDLPKDAVEVLLGAASFSFYARRLVLCEGEEGGPDEQFYKAWFRDLDTVVRPIGSSEIVIRATGVLKRTNLVVGLDAIGIVDRDFHSDEMLARLPDGVIPLPLHEIESLYCLPAVVEAVARHLGRAESFDATDYVYWLRSKASELQINAVIIERWKRQVEGPVLKLIGEVATRASDMDALLVDLPLVFDQSRWGFSPTDILSAERALVEEKVANGTATDLLAYMPGKSLISLASERVGLDKDAYRRLVNGALVGNDESLARLGAELESAFEPFLPPRVAPEPITVAEPGPVPT
jgi:ABC-type molybdenum transport system ATPase subunit/photorepair protein PhrA